MPEPEFEVFTVQEERDDRHSRIGGYETLGEALFQAEKLAETPYGGMKVRIYRDGTLLMEVNKRANQPGLF